MNENMRTFMHFAGMGRLAEVGVTGDSNLLYAGVDTVPTQPTATDFYPATPQPSPPAVTGSSASSATLLGVPINTILLVGAVLLVAYLVMATKGKK